VSLAPSSLAYRLVAPGPRLRGLVLAAAAAAIVFAVCSPYTILHLPDAVRGAETQFSHHYAVRERGPESYWDMVSTYGLGLVKAFGPVALLLVGAGAALAMRDWRRDLGLLLYPAVVIALLATAHAHFCPHLVQ